MSTDGKDDERALQQVIESLNQMTVQPGEVNARNAMDILKQLLAGDNGDYDDDDEDDSRKEIERLKLLLAEDSDDEDDDEDDDDEDDELGLTPKQREAMERVGRMITGKRKSALLVDIVDFGPFIKRIVAWGFRDRGNDRDAVFMSALDEPDRGFVKTVHPSFELYRHTKFFTRTNGHPLYDADKSEVNTYIDAECNPRYENVNPGTVNIEGFGAECWDYEEVYGTRLGIPRGVNLCALSIPGTDQLLRRLDELRRNEPKVDVDPDQDERDLREILGDQAVASVTIADNPDIFGEDKPLVLLYGLLNRNDVFHDYRDVSSISGRWMEDHRYFMWQVIVTWEVARRLEASDMAMDSAFSSKLLASLIVSDRYLQNCQISLQDASPTEESTPVQQEESEAICERAEQDVTKDPEAEQDPEEKDKLRKIIENKKWDIHGKQLRLHSKAHTRQAEGLVLFAETMKWPRLEEAREQIGKAYDRLQSDQQVPRNLYDWFYGLTLPGKWFAFTIMASLVSCTPSIRDLPVPHHSNCGFVMPEATYWRIRTGLGRVLGSLPGVVSQNGWIGPCPNVELDPSLATEKKQEARWVVIRSRPVPHNLPPPSLLGDDDEDDPEVQYDGEQDIEAYVEEMEKPENWTLLEPPKPSVSKCELKSIRLTRVDPSDTADDEEDDVKAEPGVETKTEYYAASIGFQLSSENETETGKSVTFNLTADPLFITCPPCHPPNGKSGHEFHVRQEKVYRHKVWAVEELRERKPEDIHDNDENEEGDGDNSDDKFCPVIVINATGKGTETLARAWCAEHGKSAIIRRQGGMCYSCAIRAAGIKGSRVGVLIWAS